jgi:hypothetical protein
VGAVKRSLGAAGVRKARFFRRREPVIARNASMLTHQAALRENANPPANIS